MAQELLTSLLLGFGLSVIIAALATWRGSLSPSGAVGALIVGTLIFGLGGWVWGVALAVFFISSSALSHYKERQKAAVAEKFEKGHRRDIGQVFANEMCIRDRGKQIRSAARRRHDHIGRV